MNSAEIYRASTFSKLADAVTYAIEHSPEGLENIGSKSIAVSASIEQKNGTRNENRSNNNSSIPMNVSEIFFRMDLLKTNSLIKVLILVFMAYTCCQLKFI